MALTKATYTQGGGQRHQDAAISPATLADGTLRQRFDRSAFPQKGVKYTGFNGKVLAAPVLTGGTPATSGGTFSAGTFYWKVAAVDAGGGQSVSNEVTKTVVSTGTVDLSWPAVTGAVSYKVYRGTATNTENALIATVTGTSYTDTGTAGSAGTPATSNTTGSAVPKAARTTHGAGS